MLKTFSLSDVGKKRTMNQDYIFTSEEPVGNLPNLFALADGMGGYNGGEYASLRTVETVTSFIDKSKSTTPRKLFTEAIKEANHIIRDEASKNPEYDRMGTTIVLASVVGDCLQVANVGDSRLYVIGDDIKQVTVDHSYVEEMIKMGSLDRESARTHPQKNIITRAVGADDDIDADFFTVRLHKGDMVLMCSDGLTNMLEDSEILMILKKERDIASKAEALVAAANNSGGKDNISVILIEPFA